MPSEDWISELKAGRRESALEKLRKEEPSPSNVYSLGAAYMWISDFQSALAHFDRQIRTRADSTSDFLYGMAGAASWCLGNEALAIEYWRNGTQAKRAIAGENAHSSSAVCSFCSQTRNFLYYRSCGTNGQKIGQSLENRLARRHRRVHSWNCHRTTNTRKNRTQERFRAPYSAIVAIGTVQAA